MNSVQTAIASLICGLIGGIVGQTFVGATQRSATFETVRVTKSLLVSADAAGSKGCRMASDGTMTATGGLVANQVRGNLIVGRALLASLEATRQTLQQQHIAAELTATADRGGGLVIRSRDGAFCPAEGPPTKGFETVVGFEGDGNAPAIYTQNIAEGRQGRSFVVCMKPRPAQPQRPETAAAQQTSPSPAR